MLDLVTTRGTEEADLDAYVRRHGRVLRRFDHRTQDSGNVSWLVDTGERRLFVKSAGPLEPPAGPTPYLDHAGRVALLRNAVELARSCSHPALPRLLNVVETTTGPLLVYEAVAGELVHVPADWREDPGSSYQRFAHLPAPLLLRVFDQLVDLHVALAAEGWVAADLYDGSLIVELDAGVLHVVDLDSYHRGPARNDRGRMFGSPRFMAPEELELGAVIDQRTTVFTLGRIVWHFGTRLTERAETFCGSAELAAVVRRACAAEPADRFDSVADLGLAWKASRSDRRSASCSDTP